jgi:hypothetical protein
MLDSQIAKSVFGATFMNYCKHARNAVIVTLAILAVSAIPASAQRGVARDPAEPPQGKPHSKILPRPAGGITRQSVDEKSMRALISELVACGTRLTLRRGRIRSEAPAAEGITLPSASKE